MALFHPTRTGRGARGPGAAQSLEERIRQIGREILEEAGRQRSGGRGRFWADQFMDWAMKDRAFRVQLFRFIDVFPVLTTPAQIHDHLTDYLSQPGVTLPTGLDLGLKAGGRFQGTLARAVAARILAMARRFIVGTDAASALGELRKLWDAGLAFSVDLLGEACVSDREAEVYQQRYLDLINTLPNLVGDWPNNPILETDHLGPVPRTNVSIKISALSGRVNPIDPEGSIRSLAAALRPLLEAAGRKRVLINFDMEQHALKDLTLALFERCCEAAEFPAGLALQAYLRSGEADAERIIRWAQRTGRTVTVRLIKGAYWDYETIHAEQMGWASPVWARKSETDACFERMTRQFVEAMPRKPGQGGVKLALGSHNVRSLAAALALLEEQGLPSSAVELQMLHGMADELKGAVQRRGLRLRAYAPIGELIPGMAYFVRRLLENTSNESWLRAGFFEHASAEKLLASPHELRRVNPTVEGDAVHGGANSEAPSCSRMTLRDPFANEPLRDFSDGPVRARFAEAIRKAQVPKVTGGAAVEEAQQAVARAVGAFDAWRGREVRERSAVLCTAAERMRQRRDELCGILIKEAGKNWPEADAEVCEAIDYCEYYAREAVLLFAPEQLGKYAGEFNTTWHQPRGPAVILSPWNFPLAICAGMTTAALVAGNPAIVKPSQLTPGIARLLCELLWEAGAPADVLQYLAGAGATVGAALVRDPRVALIAFTGSKETGLDILGAAGQVSAGQALVKKVVCEMGGKNAIIVDESADLDEAVPGVRHAAFSYSGQKCSACSRAVAVGSAYDPFLRRLVEAARSLTVGDPMDPGTDVGPVIDAAAARKIRAYIEIGKAEGRLELGGDPPAGLEERINKPVVMPHIFSGIRAEQRLAQEEIFGPVLAVLRAETYEEALKIANGTAYKLTGGVYSRTPAHLELARREFRVGNLYLNRGCTGAQVGRQPFGGFGLSGLGSKAGGREYLLHFVEPRTCSENTLRRGFAPES